MTDSPTHVPRDALTLAADIRSGTIVSVQPERGRRRAGVNQFHLSAQPAPEVLTVELDAAAAAILIHGCMHTGSRESGKHRDCSLCKPQSQTSSCGTRRTNISASIFSIEFVRTRCQTAHQAGRLPRRIHLEETIMTTKKSISSPARPRKRAITTAVGVALVVAGVFGATSPALAAGQGSASRSIFHSEASTTSWGGTEGRSYAQHGAVSELSNWGSASSYAYASTGIWGLGEAWYQLRG